MPFGKYNDFKDCVSKNRDKNNPEAYCASIERAIKEGSKHSESDPLILPVELVEEICPSCAKKMHSLNMTKLKINDEATFAKVIGAIRERHEYQNDPSRICGSMWANGTDKNRGAFGNGSEGRGPGEKPPKDWWDECVAKVGSKFQEMKESDLEFQAVPTRSIKGVEVFAIGTHTDSTGQSRTWSASDLDSLALSESVPLKVGHTSDEFNTKLADELDIPLVLLTGENGKGAARLGSVVNLRHDKGKLVADFEAVPEPLADLIEGGQFNAVSAEIALEDEKPILTAVALLGSENPALRNLKPLNMSQFTEGGQGWVKFEFQPKSKRATAFDTLMGKGKRMKIHQESKTEGNAKQEFDFNLAAEELPQLYAALGLPNTATLDDVLMAIQSLKSSAMKPQQSPMNGGMNGMPGEMNTMTQQQMQEEIQKNPVIVKLQEENKKMGEYITKLEHDKRVTDYLGLAQKWTAVPGKPQELAEQLASVHEKVGEKEAKELVSHYQRIQDTAQAVGLLTPTGSARSNFQHALNTEDNTKDEFEVEVEKHAEANKIPFEKALAHFAVAKPKEFGEYRRRVNQSLSVG